MIAKAKHILKPNSQRGDQKWETENGIITGGSMCQGNSNERILRSIAIEYDVKSLREIDSYNYYAMFSGAWHGQKATFPRREDMMNYRNHAWFMNLLCKENGLPVEIKSWTIDNDSIFIHEAIERTEMPVSVGTLLSESGHWISIHESDDEEKCFKGNDPYGNHPYKTKEEKSTNLFDYSWDYLEKHTIRRVITVEKI